MDNNHPQWIPGCPEMPLDVPRDEFQGRGKEVKMAGVPKISIKGLFTDQFRCIQCFN